eukprot:m.61019 g.61019  ORF g.61019 m.61019 type:complete len:1672 (-) comp7058_c0_seq2:541-5556(-)
MTHQGRSQPRRTSLLWCNRMNARVRGCPRARAARCAWQQSLRDASRTVRYKIPWLGGARLYEGRVGERLRVMANVFLLRALQKLLAEKECKNKQHAKLKAACDHALDLVNKDVKVPGPDNETALNVNERTVSAEKYFIPFRLACESKSARIVKNGAEVLQKMVTCGYVSNRTLVELDGAVHRLADLIVDTVCNCFVNDSTDEAVQLLIIKTTLAAVISSAVNVHGDILLKAFRVTFNIYLQSKNLVNQTTARAALAQMVTTVFHRLESLGWPDDDIDKLAKRSEAGEEDSVKLTLTDGESLGTATQVDAQPAKYGACIVCKKDAAFWSKTTQRPVCSPACRDIHLAEAAPALRRRADYAEHLYRRDAFALLRAVCRLSLKDLPDRDPAGSPELRGKLLSLELQLLILNMVGPVFTSDFLFIDAVKQFLCVALSTNGASPVLEVFERAMSIFLRLLDTLKIHLKAQMEVIFKDILLSILDMQNSSMQHKWITVVVLERICKDRQMLMDLFINYDCDEHSTNIFERMFGILSRIARESTIPEIKNKALECLSAAMCSLEQWCARDDDPDDDDALDRAAPAPQQPQQPAALLSPRKPEAASMLEPKDSSSDLQDIESRKLKKELREQGIELFNKKPGKGIKLLQDSGFVGSEPKEIARFLHAEDRLDRGAIGDYLGERDDLNIAVMHAYVDQVDFSSINQTSKTAFLDALRIFLGSFRLPGEAQKIDRLMEKFAQRYCQIHPENGIFASADAAYVVAYSIIMLTTDLHNAQVKNKITKDGFIRMTRGINDNKDLPRDFVEAIYDAVATEEIKLSTVHHAKEAKAVATTDSGMKTMAASAAVEMTRRRVNRSVFVAASDVEHVRPVFKLIWKSVIAALPPAFVSATEPSVVQLALAGLQASARIACIFGIERDTFIKAIAALAVVGPTVDVKSKNLDAVATLLTVAIKNGNYLAENWHEVLQCVSQLENAQLITHGPNARARKSESGQQDNISINLGTLVDRIYSRTRSLNIDAMVEFVKALCAVSEDELQMQPPRMYSLSKLVDVAHYNMQRIRIEMSRIWKVMGVFFNKLGCSGDSEVSFFAVDSLRQLAMKFLEKGELENYSFQADFLRPFEYIMNRNKVPSTRDLVVRCVTQMVQAKASNIRSGWKNIFLVLSLAAADNERGIVEMAFKTTCHIFDTCFSSNTRGLVISSAFMDAVNCMTEFACNTFFADISVEAVKQLRSCATHIADSPELFVNAEEAPEDREPKIWVRGWFPVLFGLSRMVSRCKLDVRTLTLNNMFEILKLYGASFLESWWTDLFKIIFRIFDDKQLETFQLEQERHEWLGTTCSHALRSVVEVTHQYFAMLEPIVFPELFRVLEYCICDRASEQLSRAGTECLHLITANDGLRFAPATWGMYIASFQALFQRTTPQELVNYNFKIAEIAADDEAGKKAQHEYNAKVILKCVIQLELIQSVDFLLLQPRSDIESPKPSAPDPTQPAPAGYRSMARLAVMAKAADKPSTTYPVIAAEHILALVDRLDEAHSFAMLFNSNLDLRNRLWKAGFMRNKSKPNLQRQEISSLTVATRVLFRMYTDPARAAVRETVEARIMSVSHSLLHQFSCDIPKDAREPWVPLVMLLLREILALDDELFCRHATAHYTTLTELLLLGFDSVLGDVTFVLVEFFNRARRFAL